MIRKDLFFFGNYMCEMCEKNKVGLLQSVGLFFAYKGNLKVSTPNQAILSNIPSAF